MKRREFLRRTGLLAAGATETLAIYPTASAKAATSNSRQAAAEPGSRQVLITSAHTELANTIAAQLKSSYEVRLTTQVQDGAPADSIISSLSHGEQVASLVRGVEAIVYVTQSARDASDAAMIDERTRCTYNLLQAAAQEGVRSIVYLSSLSMLDGYDDGFRVEEDWRPLPTPASGGLSHYLGEFVCREFAREKQLRVVVLRLGDVMSSPDAGTAWVEPRDVAQAVFCVLEKLADPPGELAYWSVFHIHSQKASTRFPLRKARHVLGYQPQFGGEAS